VSGWGFTGAAVGAVGYEVLNDKITFGDHVPYVASPVRNGLAELRGRLTHAFRPIRGIGQRRVMVDELWVEIPVDGRQVPVGEQGGDELLDKLLVVVAVVMPPSSAGPDRSTYPPKVGCFLTRLQRRMSV